ncbi:hypothetical protein [Hymenobacter jeollabukensis]|uniref:STAS/SEC14 domain-containing protein n=1 Tax=Hymenobacter jeollabukensis TaxID=2025313 RepID=A0A5R8WLC1_9BACT|nr:hypothetical protein [Hymenobacter jeollabukensis]TLM90011.1 hypothetical protein FDY95_18490 [Hymenobacter jeollabukensis]
MPTTPASVYFHNSLATVSYHANGYVCLQWTDVPIEEEALRALYAHTLHALQHYHTGKLLTDQRRRQPLPAEAQRWIAEQWIPTAISTAGYSRCAIVESELPGAALAARAVGRALQSPLAFHYFTDAAPAAEWLTAQ